MASSRYKNLLDDLAIEIALAENEGKSEAVVKAIEKKVFRVQAQIDKIQAKGPTAAMETLEDAVKALGGVEKLTATQTQTLVRDIERLSRAGAAVPTSLEPAIASVNKMRLAQAATAAEAVKAAAAIEESNRRQAASAQNKRDLEDFVTSKLGLGTGVATLGAAAGGLLAVGAMAGAAKETYELIRASAELADTITDLAGTYQVSTDEIQTWQRIQKDTGVTVEAIGASVTAVSKLLVNSPDKFKEWGMDLERLRSLQPEQLLGAMGEKLKSLNQTERLAFIEDFKIANELMPHLLSGFDALREKAAGSISPLSAAELESLKQTKDAITGIETAWADMWLEIGNALGSDAQVQEFFTSIKDGIIELVKLIADNREELAFGAKMLASMATFDVVGAAQAARGYANAKGVSARMAATLAHEQGSMGSGVKVEYGTDAGAGGSGRKPVDPKEAAAAKARASAAQRALAARIDAENEWYLASIKNAEESAKAAKALKKWMAAELIKLSDNVTKKLTPGAEEAARLMALNAPPGTLNADAIKALGVKVLNVQKNPWDRSKPIQYDLMSPPNITAAAKVKTSWSRFLQDAANQFQLMGKSGGSIAKIVGGVGGLGAMFEKNGALEGVKGIGSLFSGGAGEAMKKIPGAIGAAMAAFDIGKTLYSMFHKTEAQKIAYDVGRDYGVKISEGLAEEMAKVSKTRGRDVAGLLSLDKIIAEGGGVSGFGLDKTISKMRDLFSMIQTGKMTAAEARKPFDALFGEVAQASISKTTGLISAQARELMAFAIDGGLNSEAVKKFQGEQIDKSMVFLDRLSKNKDFQIAGEAAGAFLGGAVADAYSKMLADGLSSTDIAEKLQPQIDALRKKLDEAGVGGGAMFDAMTAGLAIFTNEITGPTASAFEDLTGLMASMFNAGTLNSSNFAGFAQQIGATYSQAVAKGGEAGMSEQQVFDALAPKLQAAWEAQQRLGTALDPETQALLDRALSEGKIGPEFMDPVVSELVGIGATLKVIARQGGASESDLAGTPRGPAASFPQPSIPQLGTAGFAQAVSDAIRGTGSNSGSTAGLDLSPASVSAIAAAMAAAVAGQPLDVSMPPITMDGAVVAGGLQTRIERGSATGLVTAMHRKIKERGE